MNKWLGGLAALLVATLAAVPVLIAAETGPFAVTTPDKQAGPTGYVREIHNRTNISSFSADTDLFTTNLGALTPTANTPCTFLVTVTLNTTGTLKKIIRKSGQTEQSTLLNDGTALTAGQEYTFSLPCSSGTTYNLQLGTTGAIRQLLVLEVSGPFIGRSGAGGLNGAVKSIAGTANEITATQNGSGYTLALVSPIGVAKGGTGLSTWTAANRLLYSTGATTLSTLAAGTDGYYLKSVSGVPTWAAAGGALSGFSNPGAGRLVVDTGAGAVTNILGATDQTLLIYGGANRGVVIAADAGSQANLQLISGSVAVNAGSFRLVSDAYQVMLGASGDVGLKRTAAGVLKVTNGDTGDGGIATLYFEVTKSGTQSIADATETTATFDTETSDTSGNFAANTHTVLAGAAGIWHYEVMEAWASDADGVRQVAFYKNGTVTTSYFVVPTPVASAVFIPVSTDLVLAAGDAVTIKVFHSAGNALNLLAETKWSGRFVGPVQ